MTALQRMRQAIADTRISGVASNLRFQARLLADAEFAEGGVDTGFVARALTRIV
jgi:acetyl/propionyl-CoA carboxylase alpha subunit